MNVYSEILAYGRLASIEVPAKTYRDLIALDEVGLFRR